MVLADLRRFRPAPVINRWVLEPLLFFLWILVSPFALPSFLVSAGLGWDAAVNIDRAVAAWLIAAIVWAWIRRGMRAPSARQSP